MMNINRTLGKIAFVLLWAGALYGLATMNSWAENADGSIDVQFEGTLSSGACVLNAHSEQIEVQFPTVATKFFTLYEQGPERRFRIQLDECEIGRTVQIQFSGSQTTVSGLEGALKVNGETGKELGIRLVEYINGTPRPLTLNKGNIEGTEQKLTSSVQTLEFGAYLQASTAVRTGVSTITPGNYSSVVSFDLLYD